MSLLLLPRLGTGNTVPFFNNYGVSKDGNPWGDGGSDTFDGTSGAQVSSSTGWVRIAGNTYTTPDGSIDITKALGSDAVDIGVYSGWAVAGIWACEIELGHEPLSPLNFRFWCNTGYDGSNATGMVTRTYEVDGQPLELKTVWSTNSYQDSWPTTGETQLTVTIVPYRVEHNWPGANPFQFSRSGDSVDHFVNGVSRGATLYIQWGKVSVAAVQDWIIGDLVVSEEFTQAPHERTLLLNTAPGARCADLPHWHSPNSALWDRAGGYDTQWRDLPQHVRNIHFGGDGVIVGSVKEKGTPNRPLVRRVQLFSAQTNLLVAEGWSAPDGRYCFDHLDPDQRFIVVAHDHEHHYRAVIADQLRPEVVP